jgi:hypothetical protein
MEEARISHSGLTLYDSQGKGKCLVLFREASFHLSLFDLGKMIFTAGLFNHVMSGELHQLASYYS